MLIWGAHMRRRSVILTDIILCLVLLAAVLFLSAEHGPYTLIIIPVLIATRMSLQILVYNRHKELSQVTTRRTILNIDPISSELIILFTITVIFLTVKEISAYLSVAVLSASVFLWFMAEYLWLSDRPNRWYSLRFRFYKMRRDRRPTQHERLQKILTTEIDIMNGHDFEKYVAELLSMNGFTKVEVTCSSGDYGIDVTASMNRERYAIQCKRSKSRIGIKAVQEAHLGKELYKADVAIVITNNYFTKQAHEAAEGKVVLWDREKLAGLIRKTRDSFSDSDGERMTAGETEIRMFVALFDKGKEDAVLMEKVMRRLYPAGDTRSEEDVCHLLRRVGEHIHEAEGMSERRLRRIRHSLDKGRPITPYEADIACYHLSGDHTIGIKDTKTVRDKLSKTIGGSGSRGKVA